MPKPTTRKELSAVESAAVSKAKASADANFRPSATVMNDTELLLAQVDGPSIRSYDSHESVYVGRSVPIAAGSTLVLPINIGVPGSVVEYVVEIGKHDINFSIIAERDEGVTPVKDTHRCSAEDSPVTQKFLVGTVPCLLKFEFNNAYSWVRDKTVTYKITVTPPLKESLYDSRRRRAMACQHAISEDLEAADTRYKSTVSDCRTLTKRLQQLELEMEETKQALAAGIREEKMLKERRELRRQQQKLLQQRLEKGWDDETE